MALTCNIDARGKAVRLGMGIAELLLAGVLALSWTAPGGSTTAWIVCGVLALAGAFSIFEARAGWCVVRALGFRTPI